MFNSASPYAEGRKDGFARRPAHLGFYDAVAAASYLAGYSDGGVARQSRDIGFASFDD